MCQMRRRSRCISFTLGTLPRKTLRMNQELLSLAEAVVAKAKQAGADAADAIAVASTQLNAGVRLGVPETVERAETKALGVRVFIGKSQATLSTADLSTSGLSQLVESAIAIARVAPPDPFAGLPDASQLAGTLPDIDAWDNAEPSMDALLARAKTCEEAGRSTAGITNTEGADASFSASHSALASSHGVAAQYRSTMHALSCSLIAGEGEAMQRDYAYATARHLADLHDAIAVGSEAASRTLAKMHPTKIPSQTITVAFEPRVGRQLLSAFASAINGAGIARGTSFLKGDLGKEIFAPSITIVDDPLRKRGLASRPVDGEGVATRALKVIDGGVLQSWLLDTRSAAQLGLASTGHAVRGLSSAPSPAASNMHIVAGEKSVDALLRDAGNVLYITETFGHGVNLITGDYSQGASGFYYVNGERREAVSEVTIAANLRSMFRDMVAANDLAFRYSLNTPTLLIAGMTVAGT